MNLTLETPLPIDLGTLPEPGPRRWTIQYFMPEGYPTNLYGSSGQGKSYVGLEMALAIVTGTPFLQRDVLKGNVLYLDWELEQDEQRRRWGAVARGAGYNTPPMGLHYKRMILPLAREIEKLNEWKEALNPVLTIVDSLGKALGGDPKKTDLVVDCYCAIDQLGTVLIIDHQGMPTGDLAYEERQEYGNAYKRHLARASWQIQRNGGHEGKVGLTLRNQKSNFGALQDNLYSNLSFESTDGLEYVTLELTESLASESFGSKAKIIEVLTDQELTAEEIAEGIDLDVRTVRNDLTELKKAGQVETCGKKERATKYTRVATDDVLKILRASSLS